MTRWIGKRLSALIRRHHRTTWARALKSLAEGYLRAWHNEDFHRTRHNGEAFVIEAVRAEPGPHVVFDVGAHRGRWSELARTILPGAEIHAFEIAPQTFAHLQAALGSKDGVVLNAIGLSDAEGDATLTFIPDLDTTSTLHEPMVAYARGSTSVPVHVALTTGDRYLEARGLKRVDLLKIDTEGHDLAVLRGFARTLAVQPIPVIQFEHGYLAIPARVLLADFHAFLEPLGYTLGRLHPHAVAFKPYDPQRDEQFRVGNYVAVHESAPALRRRLSGLP